MANLHKGYMGYATINGTKLRFTDASFAVKQEVSAEDMVTGHWDHMAYNYGPATIDGSISGPVTESFANATTGLYTWAVKRDNCGLLTTSSAVLYYYCNGTQISFPKILANSINISCSAGDVAQFSMDVVSADKPTYATATNTPWNTPEKLITWDKVGVAVSGTGPGGTALSNANVNFENFSIDVSNNVEAKYRLKNNATEGLFPFELVAGMRGITGSITVYNIPGAYGVDKWADYTAATTSTITFSLGDAGSITAKVQFHRVEPGLSSDVITSTVAFTGVTEQTGTPWK